MNTEVPIRRGIKSFVLRAGRMGPGQQRALAELGPRFCVAIDAESVDPAALDLPALFGNTHPVTLEIGFGMGETTAQIAAAHPQRNFLGAEVHIAGVGALLKRIGEEGLGNIRIVRHDAVDLLERRIAPDSLAGAHVFFPDPWHKKRHHKRRLIQPDFVRLLASRITPNGYVHCATDWHEYAEQMLSVLSAEPTLRNAYDGYAPRPDYRPLTKFERRGLRLGHDVWDLIFRRRDASPAD